MTSVPMTAQRPAVQLRKGLPSDEGFVARSWAETVRGSAWQHRVIDSAAFSKAHYDFAGRLLKRCALTVAGPPDDDTTIYGFMLREPGTVHLVFVTKPWRRLGIASQLLERAHADDSHTLWTQDWAQWGRDRWPGRRYVPYWMLDSWRSNG